MADLDKVQVAAGGTVVDGICYHDHGHGHHDHGHGNGVQGSPKALSYSWLNDKEVKDSIVKMYRSITSAGLQSSYCKKLMPLLFESHERDDHKKESPQLQCVCECTSMQYPPLAEAMAVLQCCVETEEIQCNMEILRNSGIVRFTATVLARIQGNGRHSATKQALLSLLNAMSTKGFNGCITEAEVQWIVEFLTTKDPFTQRCAAILASSFVGNSSSSTHSKSNCKELVQAGLWTALESTLPWCTKVGCRGMCGTTCLGRVVYLRLIEQLMYHCNPEPRNTPHDVHPMAYHRPQDLDWIPPTLARHVVTSLQNAMTLPQLNTWFVSLRILELAAFKANLCRILLDSNAIAVILSCLGCLDIQLDPNRELLGLCFRTLARLANPESVLFSEVHTALVSNAKFVDCLRQLQQAKETSATLTLDGLRLLDNLVCGCLPVTLSSSTSLGLLDNLVHGSHPITLSSRTTTGKPLGAHSRVCVQVLGAIIKCHGEVSPNSVKLCLKILSLLAAQGVQTQISGLSSVSPLRHPKAHRHVGYQSPVASQISAGLPGPAVEKSVLLIQRIGRGYLARRGDAQGFLQAAKQSSNVREEKRQSQSATSHLIPLHASYSSLPSPALHPIGPYRRISVGLFPMLNASSSMCPHWDPSPLVTEETAQRQHICAREAANWSQFKTHIESLKREEYMRIVLCHQTKYRQGIENEEYLNRQAFYSIEPSMVSKYPSKYQCIDPQAILNLYTKGATEIQRLVQILVATGTFAMPCSIQHSPLTQDLDLQLTSHSNPNNTSSSSKTWGALHPKRRIGKSKPRFQTNISIYTHHPEANDLTQNQNPQTNGSVHTQQPEANGSARLQHPQPNASVHTQPNGSAQFQDILANGHFAAESLTIKSTRTPPSTWIKKGKFMTQPNGHAPSNHNSTQRSYIKPTHDPPSSSAESPPKMKESPPLSVTAPDPCIRRGIFGRPLRTRRTIHNSS